MRWLNVVAFRLMKFVYKRWKMIVEHGHTNPEFSQHNNDGTFQWTQWSCWPWAQPMWDDVSHWLSPYPESLLWRHTGHDGVSNHQPHDCFLNRLVRRRSKKESKLRVTGLFCGEFTGPRNSEFPAQMGPVTRKSFHLMTSSWIPGTVPMAWHIIHYCHHCGCYHCNSAVLDKLIQSAGRSGSSRYNLPITYLWISWQWLD